MNGNAKNLHFTKNTVFIYVKLQLRLNTDAKNKTLHKNEETIYGMKKKMRKEIMKILKKYILRKCKILIENKNKSFEIRLRSKWFKDVARNNFEQQFRSSKWP